MANYRFRQNEKGDKISANKLNRIQNSLPVYDNILPNGQYRDCGNGQVILYTGKGKFGQGGDIQVQRLTPFMLRWKATNKDGTEGEW